MDRQGKQAFSKPVKDLDKKKDVGCFVSSDWLVLIVLLNVCQVGCVGMNHHGDQSLIQEEDFSFINGVIPEL